MADDVMRRAVVRSLEVIGEATKNVEPSTDKLDIPSPPSSPEREKLSRLAWILDDSIRLPIIGYRIGVDPIIGLIPGIGDALGAALSSYIIFQGGRLGAPPSVLLRMAVNAGIGALIGLIPFLGDLFDAGWKANNRNMRLLERHLDDPARAAQRSRLVLWAIVAAFILLSATVIILGFLVMDAFIHLIS